MESGGDDERGAGDGHEGRHCRGDGLVEALLRLLDATSNEAAAEDEESVGQDGAEHGRLNDADLTLFEGDNGDLCLGLAEADPNPRKGRGC